MKRNTTSMGTAKAGSVFGVASSRLQANRIVNHLANAGFARDDISVLFPDSDGGFPGLDLNYFRAGGSSGGVWGCGTAPGLKAAGRDNNRCEDANLLIWLRTAGWREADAARKIFQVMGASNITLGGEKASRFLAGQLHILDREMTGESFLNETGPARFHFAGSI
jgi:hypothetical protein